MANDRVFQQVDGYLDELFGPADPVLEAALERSRAAGLPGIQVSSNLGRFLQVLVRACAARTVLEIGTLGGYSTIWITRALPADGRVVTLEFEPRHAQVARANLADAGLTDRVDVRVGRALDLLTELDRSGAGPFDFVFIDADKAPYAEYFEASMRLSRPGTLIVADNVVRKGAVAQGPSDDPDVAGIQRFNALVARDPRVTACVLQQVGVKGHDGMAIAVVGDPSP